MPRIRTIKPELPQSESMGRISREARLCFILLWTLSDDAGRLRGNSRMLASLLYPYDDDAPALMEDWLSELEREGCVRRYVVEETTYCEILNWLKHQKIDRPSESKLPSFSEASRTVESPREPSSLDLDQGPVPRTKEEQEVGASNASPAPEASHVKHDVSSPASEKANPKPSRATRLPTDFVVPEGWIMSAADARVRHGMAEINLELEAERFVNHFASSSGKNAAKLDWRRAFVNWCTSDKTRGSLASPPAGQDPPSVARIGKKLHDEFREKEAHGNGH